MMIDRNAYPTPAELDIYMRRAAVARNYAIVAVFRWIGKKLRIPHASPAAAKLA